MCRGEEGLAVGGLRGRQAMETIASPCLCTWGVPARSSSDASSLDFQQPSSPFLFPLSDDCVGFTSLAAVVLNHMRRFVASTLRPTFAPPLPFTKAIQISGPSPPPSKLAEKVTGLPRLQSQICVCVEFRPFWGCSKAVRLRIDKLASTTFFLFVVEYMYSNATYLNNSELSYEVSGFEYGYPF